ncbi:MAG: hypothetical protein WDN28_04760 [Chthoniobacter sp.]
MLVVALSELRVTVRKQEAIAYIASKKWFDIQLPDDNEPYPSVPTREPRWHCLVAWSRKDAVIREWMFDHQERDAWCITRIGLHLVSDWRVNFRDGMWNASKCFLWTPEFKRKMFPPWVPSPDDSKRPRFLYEDIWRKFKKELLASL